MQESGEEMGTPPKIPFERTVHCGLAQESPNHRSREAATGALAQGGAEGGTLGTESNQVEP